MEATQMSEKPRYRIKAGSHVAPAMVPVRVQPQSGYLRDTRSKVMLTRPAVLRMHRDEVRAVWKRTAALALDLIQNSGSLRGAADQVVTDTVGVELVLNPQPDLAGLGYDQNEIAELVRTIKQRWKRYCWSPRECDLAGKFTVPQMVDISLRWEMAYGEALGLMSYMGRAQRQHYGIRTGTKLSMVNPSKLVQDTNEIEGLFQGVYHDLNGRPVSYLIEERESGITRKRPHAAYDAEGRQTVIHVFDPMDSADVRGISRIAPAFRQHIQREMLVDTTIQTAILQTIFAATLTSQAPSADAFEALEAIEDKEFKTEVRDFMLASFEAAAEREIAIGSDPQINHLAPGEKLELLASKTPGPEFLSTNRELARDMARAIGTSFGGFTMNYENATYSSVRMETSSIYPVAVRRRERIPAPICQALYENWFDEQVGEGLIEVKGGYEAFLANRDRFCWALWQGPAKPSADDGKSAKASTERLQNGTSTLADECAELGKDPDEVFDTRKREHDRYVKAGMPSPFVRNPGAGEDEAEERDEPARRREPA